MKKVRVNRWTQVALIFFILGSITRANEWQPSPGPFGSNISCLERDPNNLAHLLIGTYDAGIFQSTDAGLHWFVSSQGFDIIPSWIYDIAIAPEGNICFTNSGIPAGVYKSTDSGTTWSPSSSGIILTAPQCIVIDPDSSDIVYMGQWATLFGCPWGLWKSTDQGNSWFALESYGYMVSANEILIDPNSPATLYVSGDPDVYTVGKSTDRGLTWFPADIGLPVDDLPDRIAIDPVNSNILYASYAGTNDHRIYKTTDGGGVWFPSDSGFPDSGYYWPRGITVYPLNNNIVLASGYFAFEPCHLYMSTDGGGYWQLIGSGYEKGINEIIFDNEGLGFSYGYYVIMTQDIGMTWQERSYGIDGAAVKTLCSDPNSSDIYAGIKYIFGGDGGGVYKRVNQVWIERNNGVVNHREVYAIDVHPQNSDINYVSCGPGATADLYKSTDGGASWVNISDGLPSTNQRVTDIAVDPQRSSVVYVANHGSATNSAKAEIYKSTNEGEVWEILSGFNFFSLANSGVKIGIDPTDTLKIYACFAGGEGYGFYRSSDGGNTWEMIWNGLSSSTMGPILVDQVNPNILYLGFSNMLDSFWNWPPIFKSTDYGETWDSIPNGLPRDGMYSCGGIVFDPNQTIYLGIQETLSSNIGGVYKTTDAGASWTELGNLSQAVTSLVYSQNVLYAGTIARSVWTYSLESSIEEGEKSVLPFSIIQPSIVTRGSYIKIDYTMSKKGTLKIGVYDITGRKIETIYKGLSVNDNINIVWQTTNIPSGVYFIMIEEGDKLSQNKIIIL